MRHNINWQGIACAYSPEELYQAFKARLLAESVIVEGRPEQPARRAADQMPSVPLDLSGVGEDEKPAWIGRTSDIPGIRNGYIRDSFQFYGDKPGSPFDDLPSIKDKDA